jgi:hypothetical protein
MRHLAILAPLVTAVCLLAACGDDDGTPTVPEGPTGYWVETTIGNWEYENNRFFRLDLPPLADGYHHTLGYHYPDSPGRVFGQEFIDVTSVRVYRAIVDDIPQAGDVTYAAATIDSTGRWSPDDLDALSPDAWIPAAIWRPVDINFLRTFDGELVAADLRREMNDDDLLAVVYRVIDIDGNVLYTVGDHPDFGGERELEIDGQEYFRFKLLKPEGRDYFTFQYVLRNIYFLGGSNIDPTGFEFRIECTDAGIEHPDEHGGTGLSYLRLFGLDRETPDGEQIPDGLPDLHRQWLFDLENGLLKFPLDFPFPFAADEATYHDYASPDPGRWEWQDTALANSIPGGVRLYDWQTRPADYHQFGRFAFVARRWVWDDGSVDFPPADRVSLARLDWAPASRPQTAATDHEGRAADIRWFAPSTPVVQRWLDPDLTGPARDEVVSALEMAVNPHGEAWVWAGVMTGLGRVGLDLTPVDNLEIWINDFAQFPGSRGGTLHVDLGSIDEDFQWRLVDGTVEYGTMQLEDRNLDGIFAPADEDLGLDAVVDPQTWEVVQSGVAFDADPGTAGDPFPHINATAYNGHEDSEDLNGDTRFNTDNRYLTWAIDLAGDEAAVDVARDYPGADLQGTAWRKYVLPLDEGLPVDKFESDFLGLCTHLRVWIENADGSAPRRYQIAELRFR